jgi:hypothetical protein
MRPPAQRRPRTPRAHCRTRASGRVWTELPRTALPKRREPCHAAQPLTRLMDLRPVWEFPVKIKRGIETRASDPIPPACGGRGRRAGTYGRLGSCRPIQHDCADDRTSKAPHNGNHSLRLIPRSAAGGHSFRIAPANSARREPSIWTRLIGFRAGIPGALHMG